MIYTSNLPTVEIPDSSLTDFVLNGGSGPAGPFGIRRRCDRTGYHLRRVRRAGTQSGRRVRELGSRAWRRGRAPWPPTPPEYGVVFHAVAFAGGIVTTINPTYTPGEVAHQLADADAKLVVTTASLAEAMREMLSGSGVEEVLLIDDGPNERSNPPRWKGCRSPRRFRCPPMNRCLAVLVRHDGSLEGGHAHAPEPRRERDPVASRARVHRR